MKKIFITFAFLVSLSLTAIAAENELYSIWFIGRFDRCIPASVTQSVTLNDETVNITRRITGWKDQKCRYAETRKTSDKSKSFSCNLTRSQVSEIVSAMKSDQAGTSSGFKTWDKYLNNEEVCTSN